jgi:hypothetical protein
MHLRNLECEPLNNGITEKSVLLERYRCPLMLYIYACLFDSWRACVFAQSECPEASPSSANLLPDGATFVINQSKRPLFSQSNMRPRLTARCPHVAFGKEVLKGGLETPSTLVILLAVHSQIDALAGAYVVEMFVYLTPDAH